MIRLALTGSIGMGKSTVADMFKRAGVPVFDADAIVRKLQAPGGGLVEKIGELFPGTVRSGTLDRECLAHIVLADRDKLAALEAPPPRVLVQVNVSGEEAKGGLSASEAEAEAERWLALQGLRVEGVMTMAPLDADERTLRSTFGGARRVREMLANRGHPASELSMGMSNDYEIAVEEGATIVRLGTVLFGARPA